jgi:hypothetical protein
LGEHKRHIPLGLCGNLGTVTQASLRLGYELVRPDAALPWRTDQPYKGVDRLPYFPDPLSLAGVEESAWTAYWDARDDGRLASDLSLADQLRRQLANITVPVEVIFVAVTEVPQSAVEDGENLRNASLDWVRQREVPGVPDGGFRALGLDVSLLTGAHSVLIQPGLVAHDVELARHLNTSGLLRDPHIARQLMAEANATGYGQALFGVVEVWADTR